MIAMVVNPKDGKPYVIEATPSYVYVLDRMTGEVLGTGTFGPALTLAEKITGYPRAHTDAGVQSLGQGLGTVLYTGLCTAATLNAEGKLLLNVAISGKGICSDTNRSLSAHRWWFAAKTKYGLAVEVSHLMGHPIHDYTPRLSPALIQAMNKEISASVRRKIEIKNVRLDVDEYDEVKVDAYPFDRAINHHLVVLTMKDDHHIESVDPEALQAINVSDGLLPDDILLTAADIAKLPPSSIEGMKLRARLGIDIEARKNPSDGMITEIKTRRAAYGWGKF